MSDTKPTDSELLDWLEATPNISLFVGVGAMVQFIWNGNTHHVFGATLRHALVLAMQRTER